MNKIARNDLCWCGSKKKYKTCHMFFDEKLTGLRDKGHMVPSHEIIKTSEQIRGIRESGLRNIAVLDYVADNIRAGISTEEIDRMVNQKTQELGGIPAPFGFEGFPKSVCTSLNDQVCHGIPSEEDILKDGDIINIDVSTIYKGYFSDSSRMFQIGPPVQEKAQLVRVAGECVEAGLKQVQPWSFLGDVGQAVNDHAKKNGCTVVAEIGGHGIGLEFHEEPFVSYISKKGTEMVMVPGMVFTIEPMINAGARDIVIDQDNDWTVYTADGRMSAQWEVTIAVTESGYEILAY